MAGRSPLRALIIGSPGSGKGTLSGRLVEHAPALKTFSAGDSLRSHIRRKTEVGRQAENVIKDGGLMPDQTMMDVIWSDLKAARNGPWMLDGYPRTIGQAKLLDSTLEQEGDPLDLVINLDVPPDVVLARILDRWVHPASGRVYNTSFNKPLKEGLDDITGEPLEQRPDDNVDAFATRLATHHREVAPILDYYSSPTKSLSRPPLFANLKGNTSAEIWPQLWEVVKKFRLE
ncbi:adenylate kinase [Ceraceosorus bombacis]|uniref:Adenylate kinase n=1 Tax=Ceraceosorus bombacis TaxID=401625 RepID=A0A0P1BM26_9BASI|nr:adenylate kinase [Ceraceosorus bombacis]